MNSSIQQVAVSMSGQEAGSRHHHTHCGSLGHSLPSVRVVFREGATAPSLTPISLLTYISRAGFPSSGDVALGICLPKKPEAGWANFWPLASRSPGSSWASRFHTLTHIVGRLPPRTHSSKMTQSGPPGDSALTPLGVLHCFSVLMTLTCSKSPGQMDVAVSPRVPLPQALSISRMVP